MVINQNTLMALEDGSNIFSIASKMQEEKNFKVFAQLVVKGDVEHAIRILRDILEIDYEESEKIIQFVFDKYNENPNSLMSLMQVREKLSSGKNNEALLVIQTVFGVSGPLSIKFLEKMKSQMNS